MRPASIIVLTALSLVEGAIALASSSATPVPPTPDLLLATTEGSALRIGPPGAVHHVGLLANGEGAIGIAVAADGAFLAFTCGMRPTVDAWYSGDWYRGELADGEPVAIAGPDGEELTIEMADDSGLAGTLRSATGDELVVVVTPAEAEDGLYRRDDADGILGAAALPGNTVCAVKRTVDHRFVPAGTVPY